MMFMTAKVDMKKILTVIGAIAALIVAILLFFGGDETTATAAPAVSNNDGRVKYLTDLGWVVAASPVESSQVKIPEDSGEVFTRYNALQKSQGFDLSQYAGKNVMRYVYKVTNFPGATEPVYATLLVHKNQVIGGDITDTAAKGQIRPLKVPGNGAATMPSESTTSAE